MDEDGYKKYWKERDFPQEKLEDAIKILKEFEDFLPNKSIDDATYVDLHNFSAELISEDKNKFENYIYLLRYGFLRKNNPFIIACMEVIDGGEVMVNFSNRLIEEFGEDFRNKIFEGLEIPPLGLHPKEKPKITKQLIERFEKAVDSDTCVKFLGKGLRDPYTEARKPDREKFLKAGNIDEFLKKKHTDFVATLEKHKNDGTLFFTQEIDDQVIEYIRKTSFCEAGIRKGDKIIISKIPYMTKQWLNETDETLKRYYYCHCPWAREAIKNPKDLVSPVFCNCSAGYYKQYWDIVLERDTHVEVLESVIQGDAICKFVLQLPEDIVKEAEQ
ncbi:MAG: hypothetical protein ACFFC7_24810 [Candidatus Hermodarchaeota archaeon]